MRKSNIAVVVLNWNGEEDSLRCIEALDKQTQKHIVIAVDNNSDDNFSKNINSKHQKVRLLENSKNLGFAGGVNVGIRYAMKNSFKYVALINNDAVPKKEWLSSLVSVMNNNKSIGMVTGKLVQENGKIDSTGEEYTSWGLAFPRGRNEKDKEQYNVEREVFGASGGASLYRIDMLKEIGLFDEDFFAYYEDVDLSFRAQLAGWTVMYTPDAIAHHKIGASSSKIPGFTTYMTVRNLPWLLWKNVPLKLIPTVWPRFFIAHLAIIASSLAKGAIIPVTKGVFMSFLLFPKKLWQRHNIQKNRKVDYLRIMSLMTYDLPPNADKLRRVKGFLRTLRFWR